MRPSLQTIGIWLIVLFLMLPASPSMAKERTSTICGIVVDELGHGLIRADVFLMDRDGDSLLESTLTDSQGRFHFPGLFPQGYQLRAEKPGYHPGLVGPLTAISGGMATAPFVLKRAPATPLVPATNDAGLLAERIEPAQLATPPVEPRSPEGTLVETLAGTNRDALKSIDRPGAEDRTTEPYDTLDFTGEVMIATGRTGAANDQSMMLAGLSGQAFGPMHWTVELSRENNPSLFDTGLGGPLLWRVVRTESAAFELTCMPTSDDGVSSPEQTFRLELAEQTIPGEGPGTSGIRSLAAHWERSSSRQDRMGLDLHHATGDRADFLLLAGEIGGEWVEDHELLFHGRHGALNGDPNGLIHATSGNPAGAPGGIITQLSRGRDTVIGGSDRWHTTDPLQILCQLEYRITENKNTTQSARSSMGLVYAPYHRLSVTSNLGLSLRTGLAGESSSQRRHRELEYGLLVEQGFGEGYNLLMDLNVEDLQPASLTDFDPMQPFGPSAGGMLYLADGGSARKREMTLLVTKDYGKLLAGSFGTSLLDGEGDLLAIPAIPAHKGQWNGQQPGPSNRVRGISGHLDTFLPAAGTGILVNFHRLTNADSGLSAHHQSPYGGITGLDVGLRQRILHTAGLDLQLLMAISGLAMQEQSLQGLLDSLIGSTSHYRRIVGGLKVHF